MNIHRNLPEGDILVFLTGREEVGWSTSVSPSELSVSMGNVQQV